MRNLYLNNRLYYTLGVVVVGYVLAFFYPQISWIPFIVLAGVFLLTMVDILLLYGTKNGISADRQLPDKLSNGDDNKIRLHLVNLYPFDLKAIIIDELPFQCQERDFEMPIKLQSQHAEVLEYTITPKERGEYYFGHLNVYVSTVLGLASRRYHLANHEMRGAYPSFLKLREYELMAFNQQRLPGGTRKIRKIGHTLEFEQIRDYVRGDDIRTINWKSTSKHNKLMVNQYQEEKSQRIYMVIDKGRTMQMPFEGLSLLDYSINAAMSLSHIILRKGDRAGIMTFNKKIENRVVADYKAGHLRRIAENLYNVNTQFLESDFGRLYQDLKNNVSQRSLVILFTNFETLDALSRQMNYLRGIAKNHLLLVVFFKNTELHQLIQSEAKDLQEVYDQIIAEKLEFEKKLIIQELRKYGILSIYTQPQDLNVDVINKYLEIKTRGII